MKYIGLIFVLCALSEKCDGNYSKHKHFKKDFTFGATTIEDISYENFNSILKSLIELNVNFYNFLLPWRQIKSSPEVISKYENFVKELKLNKIEPVITLYHADVIDAINWNDTDSIDLFEKYADIAFKNLGKDVKRWITISEMLQICLDTYEDVHICTKNVLLAHARVWHLYKTKYKTSQKGQVGISLRMDWLEYGSTKTEDKNAAEKLRSFEYGTFLQPIFTESGGFPATVTNTLKALGKNLTLTREEKTFIRGTSDFLGVSHYTSKLITEHDNNKYSGNYLSDFGAKITHRKEWGQSIVEDIYSAPFGLYKALIWLNLNYNYPKVIITATGWPTRCEDTHDSERVNFLKEYLKAVQFALEDGTELIGYSYRSLYDESFTGEESVCFGLFTNESTKIAKSSANFYKKVIETRKLEEFDDKYQLKDEL